MSTAFALAVQTRALGQGGGGAAAIALYGHLAGAPDSPVVRAALREATEQQLAAMADWLDACWPQIATDAAVLDAVAAALPDDPFPAIPTEAAAYATAAEELALAAGNCCAAVAWAGTAARDRWLRLYSGRDVQPLETLTDPVAVAALDELGPEECTRIASAVGRDWERIEERASARA